jgi:hypothetical protein
MIREQTRQGLLIVTSSCRSAEPVEASWKRLWPNTIIDDAPDKPQSALFRLTARLDAADGLFDASIAIDWPAIVLVVVVLYRNWQEVFIPSVAYTTLKARSSIIVLATWKML